MFPCLRYDVLHSFDSPEEIEYPQVVVHGLLVEDGVEGLIDPIIKAEHLPTRITLRRLQQLYIQPLQDLWW